MGRVFIVIAAALVGMTASASAGEPTLTDARPVASASLYGPQFGPDGGELVATGVGGRGLFRVEIGSGEVERVLADAHRVARVEFATRERLAVTARVGDAAVLVDLSGTPRGSLAPVSNAANVVSDRLFVTHGDGSVAQVGAGDRFFAPELSPAGTHLVVQGLATGLHVYDLSTRTLHHVGAGTHPAWSPDGSRLVYERTEDDGHVIVGSDLWIYDVATGARTRLTRTGDRVERRPQFSPSGRQLAFDDDRGTIFTATLAEVTR